MRKILFFMAAAALFGSNELASYVGPLTESALLLALGIALALSASSSWSLVAAAGGALGAFAASLADSPALWGALLVGSAFGERTLRIRDRKRQLAHVAVALMAGAAAGASTNAFSGDAPLVRIVSIVVAAALVGLPLLLDADDPVAHELDIAADAIPEPSRSALRDGAALRRHTEHAVLARKTAKQVERTWRALLRLAEARARLEGSPAARDSRAASTVALKLDERIAEHVSALGRMHSAADAAWAAEVGIDDKDLRSVETTSESLDHMSQALIDDAS